MKEYAVVKISGKPDWASIPTLQVDNVLWLADCGVRMQQQVCWDEDALYIRQYAQERKIRADCTEPLSQVCEDSCMEFFFAFGEDGRYFNFECNPNGCIYLGFGGRREDRVRLLVKDPIDRFQIHTARTADGWALEYQMPLAFLRTFYPSLRLEDGLRLRANCYKCGDKTQHAHYLAWNPVLTELPDFHRPEYFGQMILRSEIAAPKEPGRV